MQTLHVAIPVRSDEEERAKLNDQLKAFPGYTPLRSTEEHVLEALMNIQDAIYAVGEKGGWYVDDSIQVDVTISYKPLDK